MFRLVSIVLVLFLCVPIYGQTVVTVKNANVEAITVANGTSTFWITGSDGYMNMVADSYEVSLDGTPCSIGSIVDKLMETDSGLDFEITQDSEQYNAVTAIRATTKAVQPATVAQAPPQVPFQVAEPRYQTVYEWQDVQVCNGGVCTVERRRVPVRRLVAGATRVVGGVAAGATQAVINTVAPPAVIYQAAELCPCGCGMTTDTCNCGMAPGANYYDNSIYSEEACPDCGQIHDQDYAPMEETYQQGPGRPRLFERMRMRRGLRFQGNIQSLQNYAATGVNKRAYPLVEAMMPNAWLSLNF